MIFVSRSIKLFSTFIFSLSILTLAPVSQVEAAFSDFKVVSFNVWGVIRPVIKDISRFRDIPDELDQLDADVVILQETFTPVSRRAAHVRNYPYRVRGPGVWGKLSDSGLVILSRWPIIHAESRGFSSCAGSDCLAHKGSVIATVLRSDGLLVDVMDTHLNAAGPNSIRAAQLKTLAITINTFLGSEVSTRPLIVGGDFNISAQSAEAYADITRILPFEDTFKTWANSPEGQAQSDDVRAGYTSDGVLNKWTGWYGDKSRRRIDYLFLKNPEVGQKFRVRSSRLVLNEQVGNRHLSDHFGVETTFEVIDSSY